MSFISRTIGAITGANAAAEGAQAAAATQGAAAQAGIAEQKRQFDALQELLSPFVTAGTGALTAQQNLIGLGGAGAQESAINALQASPEFAALQQQGRDAILSNASATGGLRGGNVQGALAQFQPALLSQLINQQYGRLGGIAGMGQASAAGVGAAGQNTASNISQLLQQQGAATAGGQLASANAARTGFGDLLKIGALGAALF
jgi:hypothetical protein